MRKTVTKVCGMPQIKTDIDDILIWGQKDEDNDHHLVRRLRESLENWYGNEYQ